MAPIYQRHADPRNRSWWSRLRTLWRHRDRAIAGWARIMRVAGWLTIGRYYWATDAATGEDAIVIDNKDKRGG